MRRGLSNCDRTKGGLLKGMRYHFRMSGTFNAFLSTIFGNSLYLLDAGRGAKKKGSLYATFTFEKIFYGTSESVF